MMKTMSLPLLLVLLVGCGTPGQQSSAITLGMSIADAEAVLNRHRAEVSTAVPWTDKVEPPEYVRTYSISNGRLLTIFFNRKQDEVFGMGICKPSPGNEKFTDRSEVHGIELPPR